MKEERENEICKIKISEENIVKMEKHCIRKLNRVYEENETNEMQAFGIITGKQIDNILQIINVIPLKINYRYNSQISKKMNELIKKYGIPGGLNIKERAWAIDPAELFGILSKMPEDEKFIGTYHMHHDKSWKGEYPKQLPTYLDTVLAENSKLYNFIIYINPEKNKNSVRAFLESKVESEIPVIIY